jgi:hypothetical protein
VQLGKAAPEWAVFDKPVRLDPASLVDGCETDHHRPQGDLKRAGQHSFFALRVIPQLTSLYGGVLVNSESGAGADGTFGKTGAAIEGK